MKLRDCPFCGCDILEKRDGDGSNRYVSCMTCGAQGPSVSVETRGRDNEAEVADAQASWGKPADPAMTVVQFLAALPAHKASLTITHNPQRDNYETVEKHLEYHGDRLHDFATEEQRQRCIDTDSLWSIHWYPDTPIGFCDVAAPTLLEALEACRETDD